MLKVKPSDAETPAILSNRIYPDEEKSPQVYSGNEDEIHDLIHHPSIFKLSQDALVSIVKETEKRKFTEEIDRLENLGGIQNIEKAIGTDFIKGISSNPEDLRIREEEYGHNRNAERIPESFLSLLWNALGDFTLRILIVCALIAIGVEVGNAEPDKKSIAWIDGFAILIAVFLSSSVQAGNDYQKEKQFQRLNKITDERKKVNIFRDNQLITVNHSELLVGDIVQLSEGMDLPGDGIVIEAAELLCDESAMTGESQAIHKNTLSECLKKKSEAIEDGVKENDHHAVPSPILLSGSKVLQGEGKFVIIVVGTKSCIGRIRAKLEVEVESTPLQHKLEHLARGIGKFGLISAILILFVMLLRFAIIRIKENNFPSDSWSEIIHFVLISITVIVVAIPEGLPLSVVISLAYSVKKMLKDNNLVRRLHACETMGGADMICSDKTGTLTQNLMTLTSIWNDKLIEIDNYTETPTLSNFLPEQIQELFIQCCAVNSSAVLRPGPKGSSTEIALLNLLEKCGIKYEDVRKKFPIEVKFPFTSKRKRMGCVISNPSQSFNGKTKILLEKGASELLLDCCSNLYTLNGSIVPLTQTLKEDANKAIEMMAKKALRTLVIAYKEIDQNENLIEKDDRGIFTIEKTNLSLVAILGIKDILRKEVPDAVKQCKKAGIKVRMVTGDNKITARAIAEECGIIDVNNSSSLVLEGTEFIQLVGGVICVNCKTPECDCAKDEKTATKLGKSVRKDTIKNKEEFDRIYKNIDVLARSRPEDKYAMVVGLKERNHVVAVTGDGTNDAPALQKADVGFAMGLAGTEVAREAADIILLDDNFTSIVRAVIWGRNIYDSIRKFLQFQLTVNVVAVGITLISAALLKQEVLQPIQMLWINLIMDTFASLALATEPPSDKLLNRLPHNRNDYMIDKKMFKHILGQAIYQFTILLILIFNGDNFIPEYSDKFDDKIISDKLDSTVKYHYIDGDKYVRSGRYTSISDPEDKDYEELEKEYGPSRHFTMIFNTFVWMQIFNFLNARRIKDELNIFEGIHKNPLFIVIVIMIVFLQSVIVSHGSIAFHCYKWYNENTGSAGLHPIQWLICVGFGFGSLITGFLLKFLPEEKCLQVGKKSADPIHDPSKILEIRRNSAKRYSAILQKSSFQSQKKDSFQKPPSVKISHGNNSNSQGNNSSFKGEKNFVKKTSGGNQNEENK